MRTAKRLEGMKYAVRDVVVEADKLEKKGHEILKLNIGDPNAYDLDTPQYIKDALFEAVKSGKNGYSNSEGYAPLRQAVAEKNKSKGIDCTPEQVIVTSGLSEAVHMLFGALVEQGDNVILPSPSYPLYDAFTNYYGGEFRLAELDESKDFAPNVDAIRKQVDENTRAIVVINPNNPTGAMYPESVLKEVVNLAGEYGVPILADEIYDELTYGKPFTSLGALSSDVPVVVMNGLSKNYLAPGWRVGWITFKNFPDDNFQEGVMKLARVRLSPSYPAQVAATKAISDQNAYEAAKKEFIPKLKARRDLTHKRLNEILGLSCVKPEGAFYAFPKIHAGPWNSDKDFVLQLLHEQKVLTVFGEGFAQPQGTKHFRIVFLPPENVLEESFNRIESFMKKHVKR
ncbi:aminotransferase class I/II-fold pyridoxal phosphate-dependent enzyme [Candidatus Micrarchaeota archaeon]|nr:aminotransferase class I/II-fold pyridoxal phosphate-dependent enzyme [Candidatus Micrarchaeota archaeon]